MGWKELTARHRLLVARQTAEASEANWQRHAAQGAATRAQRTRGAHQ